MTGPQDPAAAGRDRLRAGHADREQVIEALKDAFVQGRLTRDELGTRAGQALAARTYADLAALTADIPPAPAAAGPARPPAPARRWPLVRAAAGSGGCLVLAFAAFWGATSSIRVGPNSLLRLGPLPLLVALVAVLAAVGHLGERGGHLMGAERPAGSCRPGRGGGHARTANGAAAPATSGSPRPPHRRPTPTCGFTSHRSTGSTFPPGLAGHPEAPAPGAA